MADLTRRRFLGVAAGAALALRLPRFLPPLAPERSIEVIARSGWRAERPTGPYHEHRIEQITIHHTAALLDDNRHAPSRVRAHQRFHQESRGWVDLAYHFVVDQGGNVYEGRPFGVRGDTATAYDPSGHLLICLEGDYDRQAPTDRQLEASAHLVGWGMRHFGVETVGGHRDHARTSCPGTYVYSLLGEITAEAMRSAWSHRLALLGPDASRRRVEGIES